MVLNGIRLIQQVTHGSTKIKFWRKGDCMFKRAGISLILIDVLLVCITALYTNGLAAELKFSMKSSVTNAFWLIDGKLIGIEKAGNYGFSVMDISGNIIWQMENREEYEPTRLHSFGTNQIRLISDGRLLALSPGTGSKLWEKRLAGNDNVIIPGWKDGFLGIATTSGNKLLVNIFSDAGELLWKSTVSDVNFNPLQLLPGGKALVGMLSYSDKQYTQIQLMDASGNRHTIVGLDTPLLLSGEDSPKFIINETSKQTMIVVQSASWWSVITQNGEVIADERDFPFKVSVASSFGSGFALGEEGNSQVVFVSEKGKVEWTKNVEGPVWGLSGNSSHLGIIIGRPGTKGRILLLNTQGQLEDEISILKAPSKISMASFAPLVVGYLDYSKVELFDFSK